MAYAQVALSTRKVSAFASFYPYLLGANYTRARYADGTYDHQWNTSGTFADPDLSVAGHELYVYSGDNATHVQSYPAGSATSWYALFAFDAPGVTFDTVAYLNADFGLGTVTVEIDVSNASTFVPHYQVFTKTVAIKQRQIMPIALYKYTGVEYARIHLSCATPFTPKVGEVFFGERRQLYSNPRDGFDHQNLRTVREFGRTKNGSVSAYSYHKGRRHADARIPHFRDDDVSDIVALYEDDTNFGVEPVIWADNDSAAYGPENFSMMMADAQLTSTYVGPHERQFAISTVEQGPNYLAQEEQWHI